MNKQIIIEQLTSLSQKWFSSQNFCILVSISRVLMFLPKSMFIFVPQL